MTRLTPTERQAIRERLTAYHKQANVSNRWGMVAGMAIEGIPRLLADLDAADAEVERLKFLLWEAEQSLRDVTAQYADEIENDDMMAWTELADRIDAAMPQGEGTDGHS